MNIIVCGMGEVGNHLSSVLVQEGHNLLIIDSDQKALDKADDLLDALTLCGHAGAIKTLKEARVGKADLFIAVTNQCEVNMIAALQAKDLGAKKTIARVNRSVYFEEERGITSDMLGIDLVINPRFLAAMEIHKLIRTQGAVAVEDFVDNKIEMLQLPVRPKAKVVNRTLKDLKLPKHSLIVGIIRAGGLIIPCGADLLLAGDEVIVIGTIEEISTVEKLFGRDLADCAKNVFIVGGSEIALSVAKALEKDGIDTLIVEENRKRCRELSRALVTTTIINGDGTNAQLLEEHGVMYADVFAALSNDDGINLMASLLAKDLGAKRSISLVHKPDYAEVCSRLGIDSTISPRLLVSKEVVKHVLSGPVVSISPIFGGRGEFIEFFVFKGSRICGKPLKELNFPRGAVICAGFGEDGAFIARGNTVLEKNQRIIVFTTPKARAGVERLFKKRPF